MKKLPILLLLLPMLANAEHHRGHAIDRLDQVIRWNNLATGYLTLAENMCEFDQAQQVVIDRLFHYFSRNISYSEQVIVMLADPMSDLDVARKKLYGPGLHGDKSNVSMSLYSTSQYAGQLQGICDAGSNWIDATIRSVGLSWKWLDQALWHVQDAIREEVYGDPEFQ